MYDHGRKRNLTVPFRRDYKPHPRADGKITARKVGNEEHVMTVVHTIFPAQSANVRQASFEHMPIKQQLVTAATSDILLSIPGAGPTTLLAMSFVVEFYPELKVDCENNS